MEKIYKMSFLKWLLLLMLLCFVFCTPRKQNTEQDTLLNYNKEKCYDSLPITDLAGLSESMRWQLDSLNILETERELGCIPREQITLLSYKKGKAESSAEDEPKYIKLCAKWQLDSLSILEILRESELSNGTIIGYVCSVLPCEYTGEVIITGKQYEYWINAGGYTILWGDNNQVLLNNQIYLLDNQVYLLYDKENDFFLEDLWNPEMDK